MKPAPRASALAISIALVAVTQVYAVDPSELNAISFENNTGYEIQYLFLSPGDSDWWGADILGSERTLDDGDTLGFYISYPDDCNKFDILAIDEDGDGYSKYDFEICDGEEATVEFTSDDLSDEDTDFDYATIAVRNDLDYDVYYVFLSPGDSDMWGVDHLDEETILEPGDKVEVLLPVVSKMRRYDVHAVDEDNDTYTFWIEVNNKDDDYTFAIEESDMDD